LKAIIKGQATPNSLVEIQNGLKDIENHMLHFLDNHDEQRLANQNLPDQLKRKTVNGSFSNQVQLLLWFILVKKLEKLAMRMLDLNTFKNINFDYVGVPNHQRWVNNKFDVRY
jgi:hypothetical protein